MEICTMRINFRKFVEVVGSVEKMYWYVGGRQHAEEADWKIGRLVQCTVCSADLVDTRVTGPHCRVQITYTCSHTPCSGVRLQRAAINSEFWQRRKSSRCVPTPQKSSPMKSESHANFVLHVVGFFFTQCVPFCSEHVYISIVVSLKFNIKLNNRPVPVRTHRWRRTKDLWTGEANDVVG